MTTPSKSPRTDAAIDKCCKMHNFKQDTALDAHISLANHARTLEIELGEAVAEVTGRRAIMADIVAYLGKGCTGLSNAEILPELKQQNTSLLAQIVVKDESLTLISTTQCRQGDTPFIVERMFHNIAKEALSTTQPVKG